MADTNLPHEARAIWDAAVGAALPEPLVQAALTAEDEVTATVRSAKRILVVGAGKAGAGMSAGVEAAFADRLERIEGLVNVPEGASASLRRIRLHSARPPGINEPTAAGVAGAEEMIGLLASAHPDDVALCLISGGGSALLPAPVADVSLADKLAVTKLLHRCGASIDEMNCVRKHLSRVKGGQLTRTFLGRAMLSLIVSDVVGDPLNVIASGPTAADPTTFAEAIEVLDRYAIRQQTPTSVVDYLSRGAAGLEPETPKSLPPNVHNRVIGSNRLALDAAAKRARELGYRVLDLGSFIEGETSAAALFVTGLVRGIRQHGRPFAPPVCVLLGGETTVTLGENHGRGGRNQEFVLAVMSHLNETGIKGVCVLSGGTDGEDGPTDAAGAVADESTWQRAHALGLSPGEYLHWHDAYSFFDQTGGLIRCGLTGTNVMDVRVILAR